MPDWIFIKLNPASMIKSFSCLLLKLILSHWYCQSHFSNFISWDIGMPVLDLRGFNGISSYLLIIILVPQTLLESVAGKDEVMHRHYLWNAKENQKDPQAELSETVMKNIVSAQMNPIQGVMALYKAGEDGFWTTAVRL